MFKKINELEIVIIKLGQIYSNFMNHSCNNNRDGNNFCPIPPYVKARVQRQPMKLSCSHIETLYKRLEDPQLLHHASTRRKLRVGPPESQLEKSGSFTIVIIIF